MQKKKRMSGGGATVRDVAERAEVSPMTVSRVINNDPHVSRLRRTRVEQAIRDLQYSPNAAARRLATVRGATVALVYENPSRNFMGEFLIGALDACNEVSAHLVVHKAKKSQPVQWAAESLTLAGVGGVLLVPPLCDSKEAVAAFRRAGIAVVAVAGGGSEAVAPSVRIDNERAAIEVAEHLLALGHRNFGFVGGREDLKGVALRRKGFVRRLLEAGIPAEQCGTELGDFTYESGQAAAGRLLDRDRPPTAIFAANDEMAAGVLAAAVSRGLRVPKDLSIVGFDDTPVARAVTPQLTTVRQPVAEMAAAAIELLVEAIQQRRSGGSTDTQSLLEHQLVIRDSSSSPSPTPARTRRRVDE